MQQVTTLGIDAAKNLFQLHGVDAHGKVVLKKRLVRHKVLDLIGDLALLGKQILGNVVADRAGHAMHTALVSRILRDRTFWEETTIDDEALSDSPAHPSEAIQAFKALD